MCINKEIKKFLNNEILFSSIEIGPNLRECKLSPFIMRGSFPKLKEKVDNNPRHSFSNPKLDIDLDKDDYYFYYIRQEKQ